MRGPSTASILLVLAACACVDRIDINVGVSPYFPVVIDGYISDQPGPYTVRLTKAFDIQSKLFQKPAISAKRLVISDNQGTQEVLSEGSRGVYQTSPKGIRGVVGRIYTLTIELQDGRVYKSKPDTLLATGKVDSVYYKFRELKTDTLTSYGFDVHFDASAGAKDKYNFLWKFVGTFQANTNPELHDTVCVSVQQPETESRCPKPLPCSGYIAFKSSLAPEYQSPCECCTCWYDFFNKEPIVSSNQFRQNGRFVGIKATHVPITAWTFMYKVHAEVQQLSLSQQAYQFWSAVKAQQGAAASLFQPVSGKIVSNFEQITGPDAVLEGIFFATSIHRKSVFIGRNDVPLQGIIPRQTLQYKSSCRILFPNSTTVKPAYWD